jgi:hypothetical protein
VRRQGVDRHRVVRRVPVPILLLACAAALVAAPPASAKLRLPASADTPPVLPAGVVPAERPPVSSAGTQGRAAAVLSTAKLKYFMTEGIRPFWSTVNICDTQDSPNGLGVRASVPGNGSEERVFARFTAQWWSAASHEWLTVAGAGTTDWVYVGTSEYTSQQGGWTYRFSEPPTGRTFVLRGVTELAWRAEDDARDGRWDVVRRRTLLTETGMDGVRGGDPVGTSKAMCLIW